jgi:hypothetical protein
VTIKKCSVFFGYGKSCLLKGHKFHYVWLNRPGSDLRYDVTCIYNCTDSVRKEGRRSGVSSSKSLMSLFLSVSSLLIFLVVHFLINLKLRYVLQVRTLLLCSSTTYYFRHCRLISYVICEPCRICRVHTMHTYCRGTLCQQFETLLGILYKLLN